MKSRVCLGLAVGIVILTASGAQADTPVGGLICSDTTWDLAGSPYIVAAGGGIVIGCDATLTIQAGVTVEFDSELAIVVGSASWGGGTLVARGTAESRIVFTSIDPSPAPGDWSRIHFTDYATDVNYDGEGYYLSGCILEHVVVEYAGYGNYAAVFAEKSSPFLNYCEVRHNSYHGIMVDGTNAPSIDIEDCEVWDHPQRGIKLSYGSGHNLLYNNIHDNNGGINLSSAGGDTLTGNTITGNTASGHGGGIYSNSGNHTLTGNTITDNTASGHGGGIYFDSGPSNTLIGNTFEGNTASNYGGAIYFSYWYNWSNTLIGNKFEGNTANAEGGAMYFYDSDNNTLSSNTITNNHTVAGLTGGIYVTSGTEWLSLAGDPDAGTYNTICCNDGYQVYNNNPFNADGRYDIDARYVNWCTEDTNEIQDGIWDYFDDATRAFVVWYPFAPFTAGDFDDDGDTDLADFAEFEVCFSGPNGAMPPGCAAADLDCDGDADLADFATFQAAFTGPLP